MAVRARTLPPPAASLAWTSSLSPVSAISNFAPPRPCGSQRRRRGHRHSQSRRHITPPRALVHPAAQPPLTNDERRAAEGSAAVARAVQRAQNACGAAAPVDVAAATEALPTSALLAFCAVKGVHSTSATNPWNRTALLAAIARYVRDERTARLRAGPGWAALVTAKQKRSLLHAVCNGEGDATYHDVDTNYTVFSAFAHLKRGSCCGVRWETEDVGEEGMPAGPHTAEGGQTLGFTRIHRCRHCPYSNDGRQLGGAMKALSERLHVVEHARSLVQNEWEGGEEAFASEVDAAGADAAEDASARLGQGAWEELTKPRLTRRSLFYTPDATHASCKTCADLRVVTCTRCNGWTCLISPIPQPCFQCDEKGVHPCMDCTSFRPPPITNLLDS